MIMLSLLNGKANAMRYCFVDENRASQRIPNPLDVAVLQRSKVFSPSARYTECLPVALTDSVAYRKCCQEVSCTTIHRQRCADYPARMNDGHRRTSPNGGNLHRRRVDRCFQTLSNRNGYACTQLAVRNSRCSILE